MPDMPPLAPRRPLDRVHHGHTFTDDYEWLRDKTDPEVVAYLEAENAWTARRTAHLAATTEQLFQEVKGRTRETDLSVPVRDGGFWYFTRTREGSSYAAYCRAPVRDAADWTPPSIDPATTIDGEEVLLDANAEAASHEFFSLGSFHVSPDGTSLAFGIDTDGDERYVLRVRDLATGIDSAVDVIPGTAPGVQFSLDGRHLYYSTVDESWRPDTVWRHEVGTTPSSDVVVFTEPDDRYWVGIGTTRSRRYLAIEVGSKITSEIRLLDQDDPDGAFQVVWPRVEGVEYDVEHAVVAGSDRLLILHNDGALNFELVEVDALDPRGARTTVVPHSPGTRLEGVDAFATHLVVSYRREALTRLGVIPLLVDTATGRVAHEGLLGAMAGYGALREIEFDEALFDVGLSSNPEWLQPTARIVFTSFVTPTTVYDLDVRTGGLALRKQQAVLGGYDPGLYRQAREWAVAPDGERVPVSLVWRADAVTDGTPSPTLLYGYGSYEMSIDPGFSIPRLSLLDRGMVYAVAHVRGGGELGRHWYDTGKTLTKRNTFTDFVAVAEHLVSTGVTTPAVLVAEGRSAGGLLMGAVANLAPHLFAGILAGVPFVDALTSILDPDLPLTVIEWDEWGDPLHDAAVYEYMRSYSPYENVREDAAYPQILAVTSLNDTRVLYVEPAKWTARLRQVGAPVLLKTEMSAGHGGVSGRYEAWRERASEYAWVLDVSTALARGAGGSGLPGIA
jgi:oligopeptidase B